MGKYVKRSMRGTEIENLVCAYISVLPAQDAPA
jgi:hypothetical protein